MEATPPCVVNQKQKPKTMKDLNINIPLKEYSYDELPEDMRRLVDVAKAQTRRSYAPYSKFHVGAAIELADGTIVPGSNQENAAFPSGTCAERTACFYASASHPGVPMRRIAIAAWTPRHHEGISPDDYEANFQDEPISPCGACRQSLLEYEALYGPMEVILFGKKRVLVLPSVRSLLPLSFTEF